MEISPSEFYLILNVLAVEIQSWHDFERQAEMMGMRINGWRRMDR
jgi:hypothetical protein